MKTTGVDVIQVRTPNPLWRPILCRVYTNEGIYGDGEAALAYGIAVPAAFGMIRDLAALIIGMGPLDSEIVWDTLCRNTFQGQSDGPVVFAGTSTIDLALWDIRDKFFNVPVHRLLGGKKQDSLHRYANQLQSDWSDHWEEAKDTGEYAADARKAMEEGCDAIETDFFTFDRKGGRRFDKITETTDILKQYYVGLVEERVAAIREAVGPDADIIMESHSVPDTNGAAQLTRAVEKCNIFYFEEPNTPSPKAAEFITDHINIPISHGERVYPRWQYAQYFENVPVQVIQPDLDDCDGITEGEKICDTAHVYDISVQTHVCAGPLSTATALQLECVIPNFIIHEHHRNALLPHNRELCICDYQPVDETYKVPELPELGNGFSERALTCCDKITVE